MEFELEGEETSSSTVSQSIFVTRSIEEETREVENQTTETSSSVKNRKKIEQKVPQIELIS
jgi:hypothetical protein